MESVPSQNPSASEVTGMLACCQAGVYVHVLAPSLDPPESAAKQPEATSCPESRAVRPLTVPAGLRSAGPPRRTLEGPSDGSAGRSGSPSRRGSHDQTDAGEAD